MMSLIIGGSASGKSEYAESLICATKHGRNRDKIYYLATMKADGDESRRRIERHRRLREGKNFCTLEYPVNIGDADVGEGRNALLECVTNLVANEMFKDGRVVSADEVADKVTADIAALNGRLDRFFVVTGNVFAEPGIYDEATDGYIRALAEINARLADMADEVIEVVCGIPVRIKGY